MEKSLNKYSCDQCHQKFSLEENIPRLIPVCGHTICSNCLTLVLSKNDSTIYYCPFDKKEYRMKERSLSMFPMNNDIINSLQTPKKGKTSLVQELCPEHHKVCELVCTDDKVIICTDCALFGDHQGHRIQKFDSISTNMISKKRVIDPKEILEEILRDNQMKLKEKIQELTEIIEIKFNKFIVSALIEREKCLKSIETYIADFCRYVKEDNFSSDLTHPFKAISELKSSLQQGEVEKAEASNIFKKIIETISVSFDDNLFQSLQEFCQIDKAKRKLSIQPLLRVRSDTLAQNTNIVREVKTKPASIREELTPRTPDMTIKELTSFLKDKPVVTEKFEAENLPENFIYKFETEDHKFDRLKRTISSKSVYENIKLRDIGIDFRLDKEDLITLKSLNEEQNLSQIMKRVLKDNFLSINRTLSQYDVELQMQEGLYKLVGNTTGSDSISEEDLLQIQNTLSSMSSLESLSLSFMNCSNLRGDAFEEFCMFLGELTSLQELDITFWRVVQVLPSSLSFLNESLPNLEKLKVLKISFGEWKGLNDEGIDKLRNIQALNQLEHLELNIGRTSVTNKGLKIISECISENPQITYLKINMSSCLRINDTGFNELNQSIQRLKNLTGLSLNFDNCSEISDTSLTNLCSILLKYSKRIETLCLYFYSCSKISDKTASTLCLFLPKTTLLKELYLDFRWCNINQEEYHAKLESLTSNIINKKVLL